MSRVSWFLLFVVVLISFLSSFFWFAGLGLFIPVFSRKWLTSLGWNFPYGPSSGAGFVDWYCLNLDLLWNIFLFPWLRLKVLLSSQTSEGWHLWSCRVCGTSFQSLLTLRVSTEKSDVILKVYLYKLLGSFSPKVLFVLLLLFCTFGIWLLYGEGTLFSFLVYLLFCMIFVPW